MAGTEMVVSSLASSSLLFVVGFDTMFTFSDLDVAPSFSTVDNGAERGLAI